ncbi:Divergent protein kinase [Holotrichia oblita]|uniref:Divergent protein kinase n=1 Tax=Holotrichia oblita TaxID=644536 RepID=A0ACB9TC60_HOLOL|nr:Divergent protein kinase [Holotrichia oblita]
MCNKKTGCVCISIAVLVAAIAIAAYFLVKPITSYSDLEKCPYCYGKGMCTAFDNKDVYVSFLSLINIINYKNIYYGEYNNINVIVKKLASSEELHRFDDYVCYENRLDNGCDLGLIDDQQNYTQKILDYMNGNVNEFKPFKVCSKAAAEVLYDEFLKAKPDDVDKEYYLKNVWTILKINVEPLILQLLNADKNWPVPKYYGSCGRLAVIENRGLTLLDKIKQPWIDRAYLTLQLLQGAGNFTFDHPHLRFYLTDISADNIAIDDSLKLTFIDLENIVVLHEKINKGSPKHKSEIIDDSTDFAYSQEDLCTHSVSDHNYYAICKLLLSRNAPYPMAKNGFLHTPPVHIAYKYQRLFEQIEECSDASRESSDRFKAAEEIMDILKEILSQSRETQTSSNATRII